MNFDFFIYNKHMSASINPLDLAYKPPTDKKSKYPKLPKFPNPGKRTIIILSSFLGVTFLAAGGWYGYSNMKKAFPTGTAEVQENKPPQQVLGLVEKVGKKVSGLPAGEAPSVATVTDLAKLQDQAFFANAKLGDKVLIYAAAGKAYLYRPSTGQIILESEVEIATDSSTASESAATPQSGKPVLKIRF